MLFFGIFYTVSTTLVLIFVKEKQESHVKSKNFPLKYTYNLILEIIKLKPMRNLILLFLTIRVKAWIILNFHSFIHSNKKLLLF